MKKIAISSTIIHSFALMHAGAAILLLSRGSSDEALLTMLTMTMVIILCSQRKVGIVFSAIAVILSNLIGYVVGMAGADLFSAICGEGALANTIATFCTTEIIGWLLYLMANSLDRINIKDEKGYRANPLWLLVVVLAVFGLRITLLKLFRGEVSSMVFTDMVVGFTSNSLAMLVMLGVNFLLVTGILRKDSRLDRISKGVLVVIAPILLSLICSVLAAFGFPFKLGQWVGADVFLAYVLIGLVLDILTFIIIFLISSSVENRKIAREERNKAHLAQYRYMKLKQQVNPHFLFNNLNILDYLVNDNRNAQASEYIRKLAGIYRYMIRNEEETLVPLKDEMEFVEQFIDLLKVRFTSGLEVSISIPEKEMGKQVVPCSIQLLVENATKHNIVSEESPLRIRIEYRDRNICVSNTLNPKPSTRQASTGIGLKYIQEQYSDITGKDIRIENDVREGDVRIYRVTLPLI